MSHRPTTRAATVAARVQETIIDRLARAGAELVARGIAAARIDQVELHATGLGVAYALTVDGIVVHEVTVDAVMRASGTFDFLAVSAWRADGLTRIGMSVDGAALERRRLADAS